MPLSILESLGTMPDGTIHALTPDQMSSFLRTKYRGKGDDERRREAKKRLDLFRDKGRVHFEAVIDKIFTNLVVRKWRKVFVEFAEFQNITKRVVREISSVYAEPATREINGDAEKYKKFQRVVRYDRVMRKVNRFGNLLNHCLVWPDVTAYGPVLRVVTTDKFVPVAHPNDPLLAVGYIIDQFPAGLEVKQTDPHYLLMTPVEFVKLDKDWRVVAKPVEHGLGRMPAIMWNREEPDDTLLDSTTGQDLISAHEAVALLNTLMLKHQKSGTTVPFATGDTSTIARGQPMDEDALLELGEGVSLNTLDLKSDPGSYIDAVRAVIKQVAANYGIPESVFDLSYQSTSGFEIELKRTGLREIRRDQMLDFRPFEQELAELWSVVLTKAGSEFAYSAEGFKLDFGEIDVPSEPMSRMTYWEKLEQMDLANRVEMYMTLNPEATEEEATAQIAKNRGERMKRAMESMVTNMPDGPDRDPGGQPRNGVPMNQREKQREEAEA